MIYDKNIKHVVYSVVYSQGQSISNSLVNSKARVNTMIVPLTDIQLKAIQNFFPRSKAEIDQELSIVRHWLDKQPHLPKTSKYTKFSTVISFFTYSTFYNV